MKLEISKTQDGWRTVKLGEVCKIVPGRHITETDHNIDKKGIPYITGPSDFGALKAAASRWTERPDVMCQPSDILVTVKGAGVGKINFAPDQPTCIGRQLMAVRAQAGATDSEFIFWAIYSFQDLLRSEAMGATVPGLTYEHLNRLCIALPPFDEQRRLAAQLREQMAEVERARAAVQAQLDAAQTLPAALLRAAFERGKWKWLRVDELAETCSGTTPSRGRQDFYGGKVPWVKTGELVDGIIHDTEEHITETALRETSLRLLPKYTLLIAMYGQGQTRGRTALLACEATTNQACFAILPSDKFDSKFLQLWFQFSYARLRQASDGRGGNQSNFNGKVLGAEKVPLPPIPEQRSIAARLAAELTAARTLVQTLETRLAEIELLPAALLRSAFSQQN